MVLLCGNCCASEEDAYKSYKVQPDEDKTNEATSFLLTEATARNAFGPMKPMSPKVGHKVDVGDVKLFSLAAPSVATQSQIHPIILDLRYSPQRKGGAGTCALAIEENAGHYREHPVSVLSGSSGCTIFLIVCIVGLMGLALISVFALPDPEKAPAVRQAQPTGFRAPAPSPSTLSPSTEATQQLPAVAAAAASAPATQQQRSEEAQAVAAILRPPTASPAVLLASDDENHDCSLESESDIGEWRHAKRAWCCDKWGRGCPTMFAQAPPRLHTRT